MVFLLGVLLETSTFLFAHAGNTTNCSSSHRLAQQTSILYIITSNFPNSIFLDYALNRRLSSDKTFLSICFSSCFASGDHANASDKQCSFDWPVALIKELRAPHNGWNFLSRCQFHPLFKMLWSHAITYQHLIYARSRNSNVSLHLNFPFSSACASFPVLFIYCPRHHYTRCNLSASDFDVQFLHDFPHLPFENVPMQSRNDLDDGFKNLNHAIGARV